VSDGHVLEMDLPDVAWESPVNVTVTGNDLQKTSGGDAWNGGAVSSRTIASGDCYMEFIASEMNTDRAIGLGDDSTYGDPDFAFRLDALTGLHVYEAGVLKETGESYMTGDMLRVEVDAGVVKYFRNGVLYYTSLTAPTYPLRVRCHVYTLGATLSDVILYPFSPNWVEVDFLVSPAGKVQYGIASSGPTDLVGQIGTLSFALDNSESNEGETLGWYTPGGPRARAGFGRGINVRYGYRLGAATYTKFVGRIQNANPTSGRYLERRTVCDAVDWMSEAANHLLRVPVQIDKRADEALTAVVQAVPAQPATLTFDAADSTFPYSLDSRADRPVSALTEIQRIAQSEFGRCYLRGSTTGGMVLRFEKRSARLTPLPLAVFDEAMQDLDPTFDIRNVAKVSAHPRIVDAAADTVLYSKPAKITPEVVAGQTVKITGRYSSSSDRTTKVGGTDMVAPVATTDFLMNANANGSGADLTADFTVTAVFSANEVEFQITNNGGTLGYVTLLQARGRGIYDYTQVDARRENTDSLTLGEAMVSLDMPYQNEFGVADAVAEFIVTTWSTPGFAAARMRWTPRDDDEMELALSLEPGDPITVIEEMTGINGVYYIQSVEMTLLEARLAVFSHDLQRAFVEEYWTLGVAGLSELGVTTVLAPL